MKHAKHAISWSMPTRKHAMFIEHASSRARKASQALQACHLADSR